MTSVVRAAIALCVVGGGLLLASCSATTEGADIPSAPEASRSSVSKAPAELSPQQTEEEAEAYDRIGMLGMAGPLVIGTSSDEQGAGGMCMLAQPEAVISFNDDEQLLLKSDDGATVGIAELGTVTFSESDGSRMCLRSFQVPAVVVDRDFYFFAWGDRTSPVFSAELLDAGIALWDVPQDSISNALDLMGEDAGT
ncbi:hypothetical protein [Pseudactinotalea terrae]|uniref:hypothetical protein n=1 Tax=Pseudactinotalea terrae TaxID=1743262 RepID=UPI0012E1E33A|nr:hypothetical protein [Pseudactinotalea terrae]